MSKVMNMNDYKKQLIEEQGGMCPITLHDADFEDGEVLYVKGMDYYVSGIGMKVLKDRFGTKFIDDRIVTYVEEAAVTEDQVVRE